MTNKIVIITRAFPPIGGGGVQRIVKFCVYLQELGWDVTVCAPIIADASWFDETRLKELEKIKIIRIEEKRLSNNLIGKLVRKVRFFDSFDSWAEKVIEFFMNKNNFDFNYVITSGPPHSTHKIGLHLKRKYNFYWVSDFRDHYTLGPGFNRLTKFHEKVEKQLEQNIYTNSDLIITNTHTNQLEVLENFKIDPKTKINTIYNGYDFNDLALSGYYPNFSNNKINLIYLGGLRGDHIDGYFYKLIKIACDKDPTINDRVRIYLIGDLSRRGDLIKNLNIDKLFINYEAVPFDKVGDFIQAADGCLTWQNPDNSYKGTVAGKVFDYFGLKKPIFSLGQNKSELDQIINGHTIGIHTDVNNLNKASDDFIYFINNLNLYERSYSSMDRNYYDSFNRRNQVNKLSELLINTAS